MFTSLPQFYTSELWRNFRKALILERTSDDGVLYCEHSGKPLVQTYDIVAHHKIPLTMANVNDYGISLNPDNVMIVSQSAHNEIHGRFGYLAERKVYYVYGAPCAGKTTFVRNIKGNSDIVLDMDSIWECITGKRYEKPNALKTNAFIIRDAMTDMIRTRAGRFEKAFVIEGGARKAERERKLALLGAEPIYIDTDKKTCLSRLASCEDRTEAQKVEWAKYIEQWFEDYEE